MKRISIVVILMLVLAAWGLPTGGGPSGDRDYTVSKRIGPQCDGRQRDFVYGATVPSRYAIQLPLGHYLNAEFAIIGTDRDSRMITVPGTSEVNFVKYPTPPGPDLLGFC